jgi:hypothetical protein
MTTGDGFRALMARAALLTGMIAGGFLKWEAAFAG